MPPSRPHRHPRTRNATAPATGLAARYDHVRRQSEALAAPLSAEDCALQSMPDASPVKWHLAHTTWFFETFVLAGRAAYAPFDPAFRVLFNSYYVGVGERHPRPERGLLSRPDLATVRAYRAHVDTAMRSLLAARCDPATADAHRARPQSRAAAPGADPHRPQAPVLAQSGRARLSRRVAARAGAAAAAPPGSPTPAGSTSSGTPGRDSPSTTRRRATASSSRRSSSRRARSRTASSPRSSPTAATGARSCGCPRAGTSSWRAAGTRRSTGARRRHVDDVHAARARRDRRAHADVPPVVLRGRRVCPLGGRAAADRARMGSWPRATCRSPATCSKAAHCTRCRSPSRRRRHAGATLRRRVGVDAQRLRALSRLRATGRGASANTTASS